MSESEVTSAAEFKRLIDETDVTPKPAERTLVASVMAQRLFRTSRPTRYMSFVFMAGMFAAFWDSLHVWEMAVAFALNFSGTLWFDHLRRDFAARPNPFAQPDRWTSRFALASTITGASWGLLGWFAYVPDAFETQITLAFAFCGLMTLSVLTRHTHLPSYYAFLTMTIVPPLLRCLMEGSAASLTIAFCGAVFVLFTSVWTHNANDREQRAAILQLRNAELLKEVDKARAMAEAARDVAEENYRRTLDSLQNAQRIGNIGNWDWDPVSGKLFWSDQFYRVIGLSPDALAPSIEAFLAQIHPEDRDRMAQSLAGIYPASSQNTFEFRVVPAEGETRTLLAIMETVQDESGKVVRMAGTLCDVTQQRRYENALITAKAEAERASLAKTNFLGNLSHELRTPLNAVIGFAEMLTLPRTGGTITHKAEEYAGLILRSSRELLVLIDDLLDIAQIESGQLELKSETIDMPALIDAVVSDAQPALQKAGCRLETRVTGHRIQGDTRRIHQIVATLLVEAIRLSPPGNSLQLGMEPEDTMLRLTLTSRAALPNITEDTSLLHGFESRIAYHAGDLGLHLALMKELVRRHRGNLRSESLPDGSTSLHLRLPMAGPV